MIAWHKCCSVWRTSVQSSQYHRSVLGTSIVRSAVVIENLKQRAKQALPGPDRKKKRAKEVAQPPNYVDLHVLFSSLK